MCTSTAPGIALHLSQEILRDRPIALQVAAYDLQVNGRRQTEIENLIGDVRRREEEFLFRKFQLQPLA